MSKSDIAPKKLSEHLDHPMAHFKLLFGATVILLTFGLVMVASASSVLSYQVNNGNSWALAERQLLFAVLGVILAWQISRTPIMTIRRFIPIFAVAVLILLVVVLVLGTATHGQRNWIVLPAGMRIQPSEFAKLAVVLFGADILEKRSHALNQTAALAFPAFGFLAALILIMAEGDLGTAIVIMPIMLSAFYVIGAPIRIFWAMAGVGVLGIIALSIASPYRWARLTSFLHPGTDSQGTGFQSLHGMQALGSGGLLGVGLGGSKEKWGTLPEAHTDFIYAVVGEEVGLLGTLGVLVLFAVIIFIGLRIARHTDDLFIQIASFGVVTWLMWQSMVNIGAVLRLMPITGVPLPLISYGGSSLLPTLAALGLLMAFAKHEATK